MTEAYGEVPEEFDLLDLVEQLIRAQGWSCERHGDGELRADVPGQWATYALSCAWNDELGLFQIACDYDFAVPEERRAALDALLALANPRIWLGHFEHDAAAGVVGWRHGVLVREGMAVSSELLADLVDIAVSECDRFHPAFRFVLERGLPARAAVEAALLETQGEA